MVAYRTVRVDELLPGFVLTAPLFDLDLKKLLDKGTRVEASQLEQWRERGIEQLMVERSDVPAADLIKAAESTAYDERYQGRELFASGACAGCGSAVEFLPPTAGVPARAFYCDHCGAVLFANAASDAQTYPGITRLSTVDALMANTTQWPADSSSSVASEQVQRLVKLLAGSELQGVERRRYKRYSVVVPVVAVPLGEDYRVTGDPVRMTTMNVSHDGIGLIHTLYHRSPYYALDFTLSGLELRQVIVKMLRLRALGPVFESGGQFVRGLSRARLQATT